jgi:hypothetical protein
MRPNKLTSSIVLVAILAASACQALFAEGYSNRQKIYPIGSEAYEILSALYITQGRALPSSSGPWSADELCRMLDKIDRSSLAKGSEAAYDRLASILYAEPDRVIGDGLAADFSMTAALEGYFHTNAADFPLEGDWARGFEERRSLWKGSFETWATDNFYGYFELAVGLNSGNIADGVNNLYGPGFGVNLPTSMATLKNLDLNFPARGFFSLGDSHWNFQAGRDKLGWGPGESGNLMLGDQMLYHQFLRFATYFDTFKYTTLASFYPHPQDIGDSNQNSSMDGFKMFFAHRVEFRTLEDRLGLTISESIMYQSASGTLDIRVLNPFGFFHNYYIRANANSMLGFEADFALLPGLNLYGQIVIDDFPLPGVEPVQPAASANPDAYGILVGLKGALPLGEGYLYGSLEGARTDPFLYLREKYDGAGGMGVGYDVTLRVFNEGIQYLRDFLGFEYGNDALVGDLRVGYKKPGSWSAAAGAFLMLHGVMGIDSLWSAYNGTQTVPTTPSTANPFEVSAKNKVSTNLVLSAKGSYPILPRVELSAELDYLMIWNKGNVAKDLVSDIQVSLGIAYSL